MSADYLKLIFKLFVLNTPCIISQARFKSNSLKSFPYLKLGYRYLKCRFFENGQSLVPTVSKFAVIQYVK